MHATVYEEAAKFAGTLPRDQPLKIGDVGSADVNGTLRPLFARPPWVYTGLDAAPGPNVDVVLAFENRWSNVADGAFDVIACVSTIEHTRQPWLFIKELARIAKKGAPIFLTAPYEWPFHEHPIDAWRIYPDGMKALMEWAGIRVLHATRRVFVEGPRHQGDTIAAGIKE